jgi:very-short-patch-repair endonuclease
MWVHLGPKLISVRPIDESIDRLAARQRGYVTRGQLLDAGLGREAIKYRLTNGRLIPIHTGVYAVGHAPLAGVDRAYAALLACGPGALLSHSTAACVWGLDHRWPTPFEVIVENARRRPGIKIHRATITRKDVRRHHGIRVTSPARTVLDIAPRLTDNALARAVNDLRLERFLRIPDLAEVTARLPRHPGACRVRAFTDNPTGPTRSEFEDAFAAFTDAHGLPRPEFNTRVAGYEVDALFTAQKVIVELDGWGYHRSKEAFERDRERDATTLVVGYRTIRITWERMTNRPHREAERLRRILGI